MKFCRFCGKQLGDNEVCDCEESKKAAESAENTTDNGAVIDSDKDSVKLDTTKITETVKNNKSIIYKAAGAVAVILLFILCINAFSGNYKTPIKAIVKEINRGTKTDYLSLYNAALPKDLKKLNKQFYTTINADKLEDLNDDLKDSFEELKDKYPKWKIKFEYDSVEKLNKTELREYKDDLSDGALDDIDDFIDTVEDALDDQVESIADMYDADEDDVEKFFKNVIKYLKSFKKIKISKGYKVKGRYVLKNGSDEINKTDKVTMYVLKINGSWVIFETRNGEKFGFDSEKKSYDRCSFLRKYINIFYNNAMLPDLF